MDAKPPAVDTLGDKCHFTFCEYRTKYLCQGDLLAKTPDIIEILKLVHPHYLKDDYTHLLVLTQSCDLVRRQNTSCKARYITLVPVRPLDLVLQREVAKNQDEVALAAKVCSSKFRSKIQQFVERLLNNNEHDYFYLHDEPAFGFSAASCAFLRLPISLKAELHYSACLAARLLSLTDVFQAKLGWLVGNLYSRVGTEDWVPDNSTPEDFHKMVRIAVDSTCQWVDDEKLRAAIPQLREDIRMGNDSEALRRCIELVSIKSRKIKILERVSEILKELKIIEDDSTLNRLRNRLSNDTEFAQQTK